MNVYTPARLADAYELFLQELEREIEVGQNHYASAKRSYKSVGEWLDRPESALSQFKPSIYVQGSFRLGTAIKPIGDGEYDVDAVCELQRMSKATHSQRTLKALLGREVEAYAQARAMSEDPTERTRCWTLHYADSAKFHLDVTPCVPNTEQQCLLRSIGVPNSWVETAVSITDKGHPTYDVVSPEWPRSNPKAFCEWFKQRMGPVFDRRREELAREIRAEVESIPIYKVRTPLQAAVKLLKRHRDVMFSGDPEDAPISIIITTLSAHAYRQEDGIALALAGILARMEDEIRVVNGRWTILNPTDPGENFADRWNPSAKHPRPTKHRAFRDWLEAARRDFLEPASSNDRVLIAERMAPAIGNVPVQAVLSRSPAVSGTRVISRVQQFGKSLLQRANHRRVPSWPRSLTGQVEITTASFTRNGFRPMTIASDGPALKKSGSLRFEARTNVAAPYKVYWQIVNTGAEAERANCLRGRFEFLQNGGLTKVESTLFEGSHSIECFIVRNGYLVAKSGLFVVNIE